MQIYTSYGIQLSMKCKVYWVIILPCLLYFTETYTFYRNHVMQMQRVQMLHLQAIMRIWWQDHVPNMEVLQVQLPSVEALLTQAQLRWVGHVVQMEDFCLPKILFYSELKYRTHPVGRPNLHYKDCLKCCLRLCNISPEMLEDVCHDRAKWQSVTSHMTIKAVNKVRSQQNTNRWRWRRRRETFHTLPEWLSSIYASMEKGIPIPFGDNAHVCWNCSLHPLF